MLILLYIVQILIMLYLSRTYVIEKGEDIIRTINLVYALIIYGKLDAICGDGDQFQQVFPFYKTEYVTSFSHVF